MKLMFIGAAHEVTGSCHYLETAGKHMLVDYGMEQGADVYQNAELPVPEAQIDYVFLTHAHVDHSGMLPLLYARGFRGRIFTTEATAVTSTPATMTRKPAIFASCPTTGLIAGLTRPNMARSAILRVPMRLMTE